MPDIDPTVDSLFSYAKYLSWADLQNRLFEAEIQKTPLPEDGKALREHEWRWWGLMSYWYASLYVVVEAWDELNFSDPVVDRLLKHPRDFRSLFRRYRNAVFHFQRSMFSEKILGFLQAGPELVFWVRALHDELIRAFREHLRRQVVTDEQFDELLEGFEEALQWSPYEYDPAFESARAVLREARRLLAEDPPDDSPARRDLEQAIANADELLRDGKTGWATLRQKILREAGCDS
jgi:hypothetical protein